MSENILGSGTYGTVRKVNGKAVKTFQKSNHLIQEFAAGIYLRNCPYVVDVYSASLPKLDMEMELYDGSSKEWLLLKNRTKSQKKKLIREICLGLAWIHDLGLVHGDLKPGNIVVNWNKKTGNLTKVAIADLGFVAPSVYSKVKLTAPIYRELVIESDSNHDIFSLGVIFIQLFSGINIKHQKTSRDLIDEANKIGEFELRDIAIKMVSENRLKRPSAREILKRLFDLVPAEQKLNSIPKYNSPVAPRENKNLKKFFKRFDTSVGIDLIRINRVKIGYNSCRYFLGKHGISEDQHLSYSYSTLVILSSIFGPSRTMYVELAAKEAGCSISTIHENIMKILGDRGCQAFLFYNLRGNEIDSDSSCDTSTINSSEMSAASSSCSMK